jgi:hypothetical protein
MLFLSFHRTGQKHIGKIQKIIDDTRYGDGDLFLRRVYAKGGNGSMPVPVPQYMKRGSVREIHPGNTCI